MAIDAKCPGCGRWLRVAEEHAGKHARCPVCSEVYRVPEATPAPSSTPFASREPLWSLRAPDGRIYGPASKQELDRWVNEGRVNAECQLQDDSGGGWRAAETLYPFLTQRERTAAAMPARFAGPSVPVTPARSVMSAAAEPHRGGLILALGIISWVSCPVVGLVAWILGSSDLRRMRMGLVNSQGMTLTQTGRILGMLHVILSLALIAVAITIPVLIEVLD